MSEDGVGLLPVRSLSVSPQTINKLVNRLRALTLTLLPVEVELEEIRKPSSHIITPQVISAFQAAAGDFTEALPYALLRARQLFVFEANRNPADYDENLGRAMVCEVLARRIVHLSPPEKLTSLMSNRFQHIQRDGDISSLSSALELAIDQHCTIFLSSSEAQHVINSLWRGDWIQVNNTHNDIAYVPYDPSAAHESAALRTRFNPSRLSVPRYQNFFRIGIWLFYLFVYSQAVRQPSERSTHGNKSMDEWEILLYTMAFAFSLEESHKIYKTLRFFTYRAFGFWTVISLITDSLLMTAFILRIMGILDTKEAHYVNYNLVSFQVLSFVSPFIWMRLITVADGWKYVGTMQICVGRMLQESTFFFLLLSIMAFGFAQGLYALDAADGSINHTMDVVNSLVQALLQAPVFDGDATGGGAALGLYYLWNVATTVILLNILISLFSSAYEDVIDDAEAHFLAFFAAKTIGMIRAPDVYVYPAPFNLIEIFLIAPFEPILSRKSYAKLNALVMATIFFLPLTFISLWESIVEHGSGSLRKRYMTSFLAPIDLTDDDEEEGPDIRNPKVDDGEYEIRDEGEPGGGHHGLQISKVPFEELVKVFPNAALSPEAVVLNEIRQLKDMIKQLESKLTSG